MASDKTSRIQAKSVGQVEKLQEGALFAINFIFLIR